MDQWRKIVLFVSLLFLSIAFIDGSRRSFQLTNPSEKNDTMIRRVSSLRQEEPQQSSLFDAASSTAPTMTPTPATTAATVTTTPATSIPHSDSSFEVMTTATSATTIATTTMTATTSSVSGTSSERTDSSSTTLPPSASPKSLVSTNSIRSQNTQATTPVVASTTVAPPQVSEDHLLQKKSSVILNTDFSPPEPASSSLLNFTEYAEQYVEAGKGADILPSLGASATRPPECADNLHCGIDEGCVVTEAGICYKPAFTGGPFKPKLLEEEFNTVGVNQQRRRRTTEPRGGTLDDDLVCSWQPENPSIPPSVSFLSGEGKDGETPSAADPSPQEVVNAFKYFTAAFHQNWYDWDAPIVHLENRTDANADVANADDDGFEISGGHDNGTLLYKMRNFCLRASGKMAGFNAAKNIASGKFQEFQGANEMVPTLGLAEYYLKVHRILAGYSRDRAEELPHPPSWFIDRKLLLLPYFSGGYPAMSKNAAHTFIRTGAAISSVDSGFPQVQQSQGSAERDWARSDVTTVYLNIHSPDFSDDVRESSISLRPQAFAPYTTLTTTTHFSIFDSENGIKEFRHRTNAGAALSEHEYQRLVLILQKFPLCFKEAVFVQNCHLTKDCLHDSSSGTLSQSSAQRGDSEEAQDTSSFPLIGFKDSRTQRKIARRLRACAAVEHLDRAHSDPDSLTLFYWQDSSSPISSSSSSSLYSRIVPPGKKKFHIALELYNALRQVSPRGRILQGDLSTLTVPIILPPPSSSASSDEQQRRPAKSNTPRALDDLPSVITTKVDPLPMSEFGSLWRAGNGIHVTVDHASSPSNVTVADLPLQSYHHCLRKEILTAKGNETASPNIGAGVGRCLTSNGSFTSLELPPKGENTSSERQQKVSGDWNEEEKIDVLKLRTIIRTSLPDSLAPSARRLLNIYRQADSIISGLKHLLPTSSRRSAADQVLLLVFPCEEVSSSTSVSEAASVLEIEVRIWRQLVAREVHVVLMLEKDDDDDICRAHQETLVRLAEELTDHTSLSDLTDHDRFSGEDGETIAAVLTPPQVPSSLSHLLGSNTSATSGSSDLPSSSKGLLKNFCSWWPFKSNISAAIIGSGKVYGSGDNFTEAEVRSKLKSKEKGQSFENLMSRWLQVPCPPVPRAVTRVPEKIVAHGAGPTFATSKELARIKPRRVMGTPWDDLRESVERNLAEKNRGRAAIFAQVGNYLLWSELQQCISTVAQAKLSHDDKDKEPKLLNHLEVFVSLPQANTTTTAVYPLDVQRQEIEKSLEVMNGIDGFHVRVNENRGGDLGQFFSQIRQEQELRTRENLTAGGGGEDTRAKKSSWEADYSYAYVLKIHTKSRWEWRERMMESLCGTTAQVRSIIKAMDQDLRIGMVAGQGTAFSSDDHHTALSPLLSALPHPRHAFKFGKSRRENAAIEREFVHREYYVRREKKLESEKKSGEYLLEATNLASALEDQQGGALGIIAGAFFWARYSALRPKILACVGQSMTARMTQEYKLGSDELFEHAVERWLPSQALAQGFNIAEAPPAPKPMLVVDNQNLQHHKLLSHSSSPSIVSSLEKAGVFGLNIHYQWWQQDQGRGEHHREQKEEIEGEDIPSLSALQAFFQNLSSSGQETLPFMLTWSVDDSSSASNNNYSSSVSPFPTIGSFGDHSVWRKHLENLVHFFWHPKYLRINGRLVLGIKESAGKIHPSDFRQMVHFWNHLANHDESFTKYFFRGLGGIYLITGLSGRDWNIGLNEVAHFDLENALMPVWPDYYCAVLEQQLKKNEEGKSENRETRSLKATIRIKDLIKTNSCVGGGAPPEVGPSTTLREHLVGLGSRIQMWGATTGGEGRRGVQSSEPQHNQSTPLLSPVQFRSALEKSFLSMSHHRNGYYHTNLFFISGGGLAKISDGERVVVKDKKDDDGGGAKEREDGYLGALYKALNNIQLNLVL